MSATLTVKGYGYTYQQYLPEHPLYAALCEQMKVVTTHATDGHHPSGICKLNKASFHAELRTLLQSQPSSAQGNLFCIDTISHLEIKRTGKGAFKIFFNQLTNRGLLFPLYNFQFHQQPMQGLLYLRYQLGTLGKVRIPDFDINVMQFTQTQLGNLQPFIISNIGYRNQPLHWKPQDVVNTEEWLVVC